jgi:hypothetical protein
MQTVQAFATIVIALFAVVIASAQWWTNRQRVVMDLFDKRVTAIQNIHKIVAEAHQGGTVSSELIGRYAQAIGRARFLFGKDVNDFLSGYQTTLANHRLAETNFANSKQGDDINWAARRRDTFEAITRFHERFEGVVHDYVAMPMKHPSLPSLCIRRRRG